MRSPRPRRCAYEGFLSLPSILITLIRQGCVFSQTELFVPCVSSCATDGAAPSATPGNARRSLNPQLKSDPPVYRCDVGNGCTAFRTRMPEASGLCSLVLLCALALPEGSCSAGARRPASPSAPPLGPERGWGHVGKQMMGPGLKGTCRGLSCPSPLVRDPEDVCDSCPPSPPHHHHSVLYADPM